MPPTSGRESPEDSAGLKWSIDSTDAYSVAKVRRAIIDEVHAETGGRADLYPVETVLGEVLGAEMERGGHLALAATVEHGVGGSAIHVYTQGHPAIATTQNELRKAIVQAHRVPMSIEITAQGAHICLRVPAPHEIDVALKAWQAATSIAGRRLNKMNRRFRA